MTPLTLHLLRHGAVETPGRLLGHTDSAPTSAGIAACIQRVCDLDVTAVIASDLMRARLAAEAIAGRKSLTMTIDPRWRELDFGAWDGSAPDEIAPEALTRFYADPDANPPPGGERWSALVARVSGAINDLCAEHASIGVSAPASVLVVTHGGVQRAALAVLCGFAHRQIWSFHLPCAALLSLRIWSGATPTAQIAGLRA